jgi:hypothetical protein
MQASAATPAGQACRNCGDATPGAYCPACGQPRATRLVSLRRIMADAVEDHLSLNAATPRTLGVLLTRPGGLTAEYLQGRIVRYLPPLRLYIIASFVFFLTLGLTGGSDGAVQAEGGAEILVLSAAMPRDTAPADPAGPMVVQLPPIPLLSAATEARIAERLQRMGSVDAEELRSAMARELLARAPIGMFLLLPFLAGVLKLLYIRQRRLYVEHLIFAVHLQAFAFVLFTAMMLMGAWPTVRQMLGFWLLVYVVLAFRRVYPQPWPKTLAKLALLGGIYVTGLLVTVVGLVLLTLLTMPV